MTHLRLSLVGILGLAVALFASRPTPTTVSAAEAALLPDLRMEKPLHPRINVDKEGHHLLKFGTLIANIGEGRLQIRNNVNWVKVRLFNNARNVQVIR